MTESPPPAGHTPPAPWWQRHPRWLVAVVILGSAGVMTAVVAAVFIVVVGSIKSSDIYVEAMDRVRHSSVIASSLGSPLREDVFVTGNIHVSGPTGLAELEIPVTGPKGRARVYVDATKQVGEWHFDHLVVQLEPSGQRLDLLPAPPKK
jgi:hypothetical protein